MRALVWCSYLASNPELLGDELRYCPYQPILLLVESVRHKIIEISRT